MEEKTVANNSEQRKETKKDYLGSISSSLPLLTVILIALGLTKQAMYYSNFDVPIKYFIAISELPLIISVDLLGIFTTLFGIASYFFINRDGFKNVNPKIQSIFFNYVPVLAFLLTLLGTIMFAKTLPSRLIWGCFLLATFSYIFIGGYKRHISELLNLSSKVLIITVAVTISTLCLLMLKTGYEIIKVENGSYKGTKIYTADSIYTSTDSNYFIGKTEKYIFIYNKKDSTTSVIPSELVTKMVLKSKSY